MPPDSRCPQGFAYLYHGATRVLGCSTWQTSMMSKPPNAHCLFPAAGFFFTAGSVAQGTVSIIRVSGSEAVQVWKESGVACWLSGKVCQCVAT